jgi:hypothetical protein
LEEGWLEEGWLEEGVKSFVVSEEGAAKLFSKACSASASPRGRKMIKNAALSTREGALRWLLSGPGQASEASATPVTFGPGRGSWPLTFHGRSCLGASASGSAGRAHLH